MLVESGGDAFAWGDDGRAIGLWQVHPSWVFDWAGRLRLSPLVDERWNDFVQRLVIAFFEYHPADGFTPVQVAMHFHLGHIVYEGASTWDVAYAERFMAASVA